MQIRAAHAEDAVAACTVLRRSIAELCWGDHRDVAGATDNCESRSAFKSLSLTLPASFGTLSGPARTAIAT
jgi:hypothetical protein